MKNTIKICEYILDISDRLLDLQRDNTAYYYSDSYIDRDEVEKEFKIDLDGLNREVKKLINYVGKED